jgi:hypothetical protein
MIRNFSQFVNENNKPVELKPSESEGQYELTHQAYTFLHEKGHEPKTESEEVWNELHIFDIVRLLKGREMVTNEGYGGENKYGNLPTYIRNRVYRDCEMLEGSHTSYGTWDTCAMYAPKDNPESKIAVLMVDVRKTRGSAFTLHLVEPEKKMVVTHRIKKYVD